MIRLTLVTLAVSFVLTFLATKPFIKLLKKAGLTGKDMNKPDKPEVAEMGGFAINWGFGLAMVAAIAYISFVNQNINEAYFLLAALATVFMISFIGVIDDLLSVKQSYKAVLPGFAGLCLIAVRAGVTEMTFPILGAVDLGVFYYLIVFMGVAGAANAYNVYEGFNGQSAGVGAISFFVMMAAALHTGQIEAAVTAGAMLGACLAFLWYNWYPAKIFPGDVGTLSMGAALASCAVIGNLERVGVILIIPHLMEFIMKVRGKLKTLPWVKPGKDGKVHRVAEKDVCLGHLILKVSPSTEKSLVLKMYFIQAVVGALAIMSVM